MPKCPRCKRVWLTLDGEEQDQDCPRCGDVYGRNKSDESYDPSDWYSEEEEDDG